MKKLLTIGLILLSIGMISLAGVWFYSLKQNQKDDAPLIEVDVPTPSEAVDAVESVWENEIVGSEGEVEDVASTPNLEEVIKLYNLQALTYHYNSICHIYEDDDEENGELLYHISYAGTVVLGIDMSQVTCDIDDENHIVHVYLPQVEIQSSHVDSSSIEYIFADDSANNSQAGTQALARCTEDFEAKIENETVMFELARESCDSGIRALCAPIVEYYFEGYELEIEFV